jgi:hypothetical protein
VTPAVQKRAPEPAAAAVMRAATLSTLEGDVITHGIAELHGTADAWSATLGHLDRPGILVGAYFSQGLRDVVLSLNDGRRARARVTGTSFATAGERTCALAGVEPLQHVAAA